MHLSVYADNGNLRRSTVGRQLRLQKVDRLFLSFWNDALGYISIFRNDHYTIYLFEKGDSD